MSTKVQSTYVFVDAIGFYSANIEICAGWNTHVNLGND